MAEHIRKCVACGNYTLEKKCCSQETILPKPPKFSLTDKYSHLKRLVKKKELAEKGLY